MFSWEANCALGGLDGQARRVLNEVRRDLESIHKILED